MGHAVEEGDLMPVAEARDAAALAVKATGCANYLFEDHKYLLREAQEGEAVLIEARVLACDAKRFHPHMQMSWGGEIAALAEMMALHVGQNPRWGRCRFRRRF